MASWSDVLKCPCFVVNMDRCHDRLQTVTKRITDNGFLDIQRIKAVDATIQKDLDAGWSAHGHPKFDEWDKEFNTYKGKQGCFLSHANIWLKMINENIPMAMIFEDDVLFHPDFKVLAPLYYEKTPTNFDVIFLGSQFCFESSSHIDRGPVFCTHAMLVTLNGAKKMYDATVKREKGVYTIDFMLKVEMEAPTPAFEWYVWNGRLFPTKEANMSRGWSRRNCGLVFQDDQLGSYIKEEY